MPRIGLGLRKSFLFELAQNPEPGIDFLEVAPENYIDRHGLLMDDFEKLAQIYPLAAHGLTLGIGNPDPLDFDYLTKVKKFIKQYKIKYFTDHLCLSSNDQKYFHDLIPLPFSWEAVEVASQNARVIQDFLEVPLGLENISYYAANENSEMTEAQFLCEILQRSQTRLMLDINNVYVNAFNHGGSATQFIDDLQGQPIIQMHIAGHTKKNDSLIIDSHGEPIVCEVWDLLSYFKSKNSVMPPIVVERDYDIPPLKTLMSEIKQTREIIQRSQQM